MKLGIISDIHACIDSLEKAFHLLRKTGVDEIYHAGDIVGYGKSPNEVVDFIKKNKIKGVLGNFDEAVAFNLPSCGCHTKNIKEKMKVQYALKEAKDLTSNRNKVYLRNIPGGIRFEINHKKILIVHATIFGIAHYLYKDADKKHSKTSPILRKRILLSAAILTHHIIEW